MSPFNVNEINLCNNLESKLKISDDEKDKIWKNAGTKVGLEIWRIEKFNVKEWPKNQYGKFYSGDSYIILNTWKNESSDSLYYDVHFWLGLKTTQDEAGTAAYKTVELDDKLGGRPVQHREIQGNESTLFLSYFPKLMILEGGVESGFNPVKPVEYKPQLFHIKSIGRCLTVKSVPMSYKSLNSGDVFILDAGLNIYQWNGSKASGNEKHKAMELTSQIKSERDGKAEITVFEQNDADATKFWDGIGGKGPVSDEDTKKVETTAAKEECILSRLSDSSGKLVFKEEARGKLSKSMLDTNDVFIVDVISEVFVWVGKNASQKERQKGLQYAMEYIVKNNRPGTTPISKINEGTENSIFQKYIC